MNRQIVKAPSQKAIAEKLSHLFELNLHAFRKQMYGQMPPISTRNGIPRQQLLNLLPGVINLLESIVKFPDFCKAVFPLTNQVPKITG